MPEFYNHTLVVRPDELIPAFFKSKSYLSVQLSRHEERGYGMKRARKGGGLNNDALIEFDSLPKRIRDCFVDPRKCSSVLEQYYHEASDAFRYYSNTEDEGFTYPDGSELKLNTIEQLTINASVMLAALDLFTDREIEWTNKGKACRSLLRSVHADVVDFNDVLKDRGEMLHTLPSTYKRFSSSFKDFRDSEKPFYTLIKKP